MPLKEIHMYSGELKLFELWKENNEVQGKIVTIVGLEKHDDEYELIVFDEVRQKVLSFSSYENQSHTYIIAAPKNAELERELRVKLEEYAAG